MSFKIVFALSLLLVSGSCLASASISESRLLFHDGKTTAEEMNSILQTALADAQGNAFKQNIIKKEIGFLDTYIQLKATDSTGQQNIIEGIIERYYRIASSDYEEDQYLDEQLEALYLLRYLKERAEPESEPDRAVTQLATFLGSRLYFSYSDAKATHQTLTDENLKQKYEAIFKRFVEIDYGKSHSGAPEDARYFTHL